MGNKKTGLPVTTRQLKLKKILGSKKIGKEVFVYECTKSAPVKEIFTSIKKDFPALYFKNQEEIELFIQEKPEALNQEGCTHFLSDEGEFVVHMGPKNVPANSLNSTALDKNKKSLCLERDFIIVCNT